VISDLNQASPRPIGRCYRTFSTRLVVFARRKRPFQLALYRWSDGRGRTFKVAHGGRPQRASRVGQSRTGPRKCQPWSQDTRPSTRLLLFWCRKLFKVSFALHVLPENAVIAFNAARRHAFYRSVFTESNRPVPLLVGSKLCGFWPLLAETCPCFRACPLLGP